MNENFKNLYNNYFNILKDNIPEYNRGNFYNIGHDILRAHMMAHIDYTNEKEIKKNYSLLTKKLMEMETLNSDIL